MLGGLSRVHEPGWPVPTGGVRGSVDSIPGGIMRSLCLARLNHVDHQHAQCSTGYYVYKIQLQIYSGYNNVALVCLN